MTSRPTLLSTASMRWGWDILCVRSHWPTRCRKCFVWFFSMAGRCRHIVSLPQAIGIINLPPLRLADGQLISCDNRYSVAQAQDARIDQILSSFRRLRPEVLLTELYPFGRKKFEFELLPLLEEAKTQSHFAPLIVCSLRDIW